MGGGAQRAGREGEIARAVGGDRAGGGRRRGGWSRESMKTSMPSPMRVLVES